MIYKTNLTNVFGKVASVWDTLLFSYTTKVVMLGNISESLEIGDLPIVPANTRATPIFQAMKEALRTPIKILSIPFPFISSFQLFSFRKGSGWEILCKLTRLNKWVLLCEVALAAVSAALWYSPAFFLQKLVKYLEEDPERVDRRWGWVFVAGMFGFNAFSMLGTFSRFIFLHSWYVYSLTICDTIVSGQLWSLATCSVQVRLRIQLNSILFAKTLVRKDVASSAAPISDSEETSGKSKVAPAQELSTASTSQTGTAESQPVAEKKDEDDGDFSSKAQIMTLMTTDVDRVSEFAWHMFTLVGMYFLFPLPPSTPTY